MVYHHFLLGFTRLPQDKPVLRIHTKSITEHRERTTQMLVLHQNTSASILISTVWIIHTEETYCLYCVFVCGSYLNSHRPQYEMCLWFREVGLHLWRHANQGAVGHNSYHTHGFKGELWTERAMQLQSVRNWTFFESWTQSITILFIDLCGWFRKCYFLHFTIHFTS